MSFVELLRAKHRSFSHGPIDENMMQLKKCKIYQMKDCDLTLLDTSMDSNDSLSNVPLPEEDPISFDEKKEKVNSFFYKTVIYYIIA